MKKLLSFLLLFLPAISMAAPQSIPKFRGLHNSDSAILINDDEAQDLQDVDFTSSGSGIKKRAGYASFKTIGTSTHGVRGGYYFRAADGSDLIIHANDHGAFYSETGGDYTAFITTDAVGGYYDFTDSQGYLWRATSNLDQIAKYDGTTLTYYPSAPKGDQVETLPSRLVISGTSANPNRLNFSAEADFSNFTIGALESDPYTEDIGLPGQDVNAIKVSCGEDVLVWTRDTTSKYSGTNQYNGKIDLVSNTIGTNQPGTVIQDYGITYWQGQDSHFYSYDCNLVSKISEKLDVSNFLSGNDKSYSITSQADFQTGTIGAGLSATASPGDIVFSPTTIDDFSDGDYTSSPAWEPFDVSNGTFSVTGGELKFDSTGSNGHGGLRLANSYPSVGTWEFDYRSDSINNGFPIFRICSETPTEAQPAGANDDCYTADILTSLSEIYENDTQIKTETSPSRSSNIDYNFAFERGSSNQLKFYSDDTVIVSTVDATIANISTISFGLVQAANGSVNWYFDDVKFNHFISTYQTTAISIGTSISAWGRLSAEEALDGATIAYAVYADSNTAITITDATTFTSSQTITNNSLITLSTAPYLTVACFFTRTAHTQSPTLSGLTVGWVEGTVIRHFGSVDNDHRLMWSIAEGNTTVANKTYVYDPRFDSWLRYSVPFDAPAKVGSSIYFGNPSTGNVYVWPSGTTDNGAAITAYWKSKDFVSGDPFTEKGFNNYSIVAKESIGSNLDVTYTIDGTAGTTANYSLTDPLSTVIRRINANLPVGTKGSFINWKFGNDDIDTPFEIYGFSYDYTPKPWRVLP